MPLSFIFTSSSKHVPHGRNHALEADKEHRRRQVHRFVRLVLVCACRLTRAQIGELCIGQVELHESLERETAVAETEAAGERVVLALLSVARKMEHGNVG
jgi:16S rRNA U516 pseudouridylate synthase RsuA-like enzyme